MTPFEQFVHELVLKIQTGSPLFDCLRVDIAFDSESGVVIVLLYTRPPLTEWFLTIPPFQYPLPLLLNNCLLYQYVKPDVGSGMATLSLSELMRAAVAGVTRDNLYGTMIGKDAGNSTNMTWYVPLVEFGDRASLQSRLWSAILLDPRYPVSSIDNPSGVAQLVVVHMPASSVFELSKEQLLHITKLTLGWNYSRVLSEDRLQYMAEVFLAAAMQAQTIAEF